MTKLLAKIGCVSLFDAIFMLPKSYTNTFILKSLDKFKKTQGVVRVRIHSHRKSPKVLKIEAFMLDFDEFLEITIFNAKPYHSKVFSTDLKLYIFGTFEFSSGIWRVTQPKIITKTNQITMNFTTTKFKSQTLNDTLRELVSVERIVEMGLDRGSAEAIHTIFHPETSPLGNHSTDFENFNHKIDTKSYLGLKFSKNSQSTTANAGSLDTSLESKNERSESEIVAQSAETLKSVVGGEGESCERGRGERLRNLSPLSLSQSRIISGEAIHQNKINGSNEVATQVKKSESEAELKIESIGLPRSLATSRNDKNTESQQDSTKLENTAESTKNSAINENLAPKDSQNKNPIQISQATLDFITTFNKNGLFGKYLHAIKLAEIYRYMLGLRMKKREFLATSRLNSPTQDFIKSLPFSLTKGQSECIAALSQMLDSTKATRCVVMGDVGCGKTIVILSCVVMAYPKKSVLLAPTTILAKQLFVESKKFLPSHIKVSLALQGENEGESVESCDFLIGTHTLLYRELSGFDLFMTDEQHRFGTKQRLKLEQMLSIDGKKPHSIQFSATPIPRTMALIESNLVDFLFIKDLPFEKNIKSKIITKSDFKALVEHIKAEVAQNRQVAIIYPLVEPSDTIKYQSIEEGLPFWLKNFQAVYSTHGRDKNKEEVIEEFRDNGSILIATTLFEVGISLPKLSTIIIVGAERLGFATLHQLRGRVSRNGLDGFCYLYTNNEDSARLRDFVATMSGFEIAELDLKYRSSGDLLSGIRQSGEQFKYFDAYNDKKIAQEAMILLGESPPLKKKWGLPN